MLQLFDENTLHSDWNANHFSGELRGIGFSSQSLGDREIEMLCYVAKLTFDPGGINNGDVQRLRTIGFDDLAIHDICAIAAHFAFANRIADGLGIDLEK